MDATKVPRWTTTKPQTLVRESPLQGVSVQTKLGF